METPQPLGKNYYKKYKNPRAHEQTTTDEDSFLTVETQSCNMLSMLAAFSGQGVKKIHDRSGSDPFNYDF